MAIQREPEKLRSCREIHTSSIRCGRLSYPKSIRAFVVLLQPISRNLDCRFLDTVLQAQIVERSN